MDATVVTNEYTNELEEALERGRRAKLTDYAIGATMISILFAIAMFIVPMIPVALREPPVEIIEANTDTPMPVCPGERVWVEVNLSITEPGIIGQWSGLLVSETDQAVPHTRMEWTPIVRDRAEQRRERIFIEIPDDTEPGAYTFISAWAAINSDTRPEFIRIPINVSEDCDMFTGEED